MSLRAKSIELVINGKNKTIQMVKGVIGGLGKIKNSVFSLKTAITGALGGAALGALSKSFVDAARETENYQVRLKVLLGSQKEGNRLFKEMSDYAGRVPFEYNEIMGAATQLAGVMKGGVDEITKWMPLIGDLAAASGLGIRETTDQVSRMLSAGAASADLFRERGILSMLGFQAGVSYSAEETRKKLMEEWNKAGSRFKGATGEMASTWDGMMSMLSDAWFQFRQMVMESGVFDGLKAGVKGVIDKIEELKKSGKLADLAKGFGDNIMSGIKSVLGALPGIVRGAFTAAEMLVKAVNGWRMIKGLFEIFFKQVQIWSFEFINSLRSAFVGLLNGLGKIPGVNLYGEVADVKEDQARTSTYIKENLQKELQEAKKRLDDLIDGSEKTQETIQQSGERAAEAVKEVTAGALKGMEEGHAKIASASKQSTDAQISDLDRLIAKYNELNKIKLSGTGNLSTYKSPAESIADTLDDEADR